MAMTKSTAGKWALGIAGTILLGALGSGLWDIALKSAFTSAGRGILTALTFGYGSVRDGFYVEIAQGHTDRASLWLVAYSTIPMFWGFAFFIAWMRRGGEQKETAEEATRMRSDASYREKRLGELKAELKVLERRLALLQRAALLLGIFMLSLLVFRAIKLTYISSAITHYEQAFTICLPYLSEPERSSIRSQYAQIKTKEDYVRVLQRLQDVATGHAVTLPTFNPW